MPPVPDLSSIYEQLGRLSQAAAHAEQTRDEIRAELAAVNRRLDELYQLLNQVRGAGKMARWAWAVGLALSGAIGWVLAKAWPLFRGL